MASALELASIPSPPVRPVTNSNSNDVDPVFSPLSPAKDTEAGFILFENATPVKEADSSRVSTAMFASTREYSRRGSSSTASANTVTAMFPESAEYTNRRGGSFKIGEIRHSMYQLSIDEMLQAVNREPGPPPGMQPLIITLVRHGETDDNRKHVLQGQIPTALNAAGIEQGKICAQRIAREIKDVSYIISSDLPRARETAELIRDAYPYRKLPLELTELLRERSLGVFEGQKVEEVKAKVGDLYKKFREPRMPYVLDYLGINNPETKVETLNAMISRTKQAIRRVLNLGAAIARENYIPYNRSEQDDGDECEHTAQQAPAPPHILVVGHGMIIRCFLSVLLANRNLHPLDPSTCKDFYFDTKVESFAWLGCTFSNTCINKMTIQIQPYIGFEKEDPDRAPFFSNPLLLKVNDFRHLAKMDVVKPKTAE